MPVRENLSGIEIWPEGDQWKWQVVRFSDRGTRTIARGTAASEEAARRAARWRAARGWLSVAGAVIVVGLALALYWLLA